MRAVLIDDDTLCLDIEATVLENVEMIDEVKPFHAANDLISYMMEEVVDVAFLDIMMDDADGISLAMEIKRIQPQCKIIFVSSSREFALEAFQVYASRYLLKPMTEDEVVSVLLNI